MIKDIAEKAIEAATAVSHDEEHFVTGQQLANGILDHLGEKALGQKTGAVLLGLYLALVAVYEAAGETKEVQLTIENMKKED